MRWRKIAKASAKELREALAVLGRMSAFGARSFIRSLPAKQRRRALRTLRSFMRKSAKIKRIIKNA